MQPSGTLYAGERFLRTDMNGDGIYDEKDQYEYDNSDPFYRAGGGDTMQTVTMEEWLEKIAEYLYVDENGRMQTIRELSPF